MSFIEPASPGSPPNPATAAQHTRDGHAPNKPILHAHANGDTHNGQHPAGFVVDPIDSCLIGPSQVDRDLMSEPEWRELLEQLGVEDLRCLTATMPVIEQAKGALMGYDGCDATAAFALWRRWSSTRNIKLRTVAATVVAAGSHPSSIPYEALHRLLEHDEAQP